MQRMTVRSIIKETVRKIGISIRPATREDRHNWDTVVYHPLQSWAWGQFRAASDIDVVRLAVTKGGKLVDGWQVTFHKLPFTRWTIGYFPKGPVITREMLETLKTQGKQKRAIFIQLEPNVLSNETFQSRLPSEHASHFKSLRPSHHPLFPKHTFVLDLTKPEGDLLKVMHPKTRYNIRVAQKHGVVVKEDNSKEAFNAYLKLSAETTHRQRFYAHNETYHRRMWETLQPAGIAKLFTATYQGDILAAWIIFVWKDTVYYPYGASSRQRREVMAPTLTLWEIARWAKNKGLTYFDLWGALGPNPDPDDPWYCFHRFKQGFAPKLIEFIGSYDLVLSPFLYHLSCLTDSLRWFLLKR